MGLVDNSQELDPTTPPCRIVPKKVYTLKSRFDEYNMHEDIRRWRYDGCSFRQVIQLIKEKFNVNVSYTSLYSYCSKHGLIGDLSGNRQQARNGFQELLDSLKVVQQGLALNQALFENLEQDAQKGKLDTKQYCAVMNSNERLLSRRESLVKTLTQQQALIYRYVTVSEFIDKVQEIVVKNCGLSTWNKIKADCKNSFEFCELLKRIPEETVKMEIPVKKIGEKVK